MLITIPFFVYAVLQIPADRPFDSAIINGFFTATSIFFGCNAAIYVHVGRRSRLGMLFIFLNTMLVVYAAVELFYATLTQTSKLNGIVVLMDALLGNVVSSGFLWGFHTGRLEAKEKENER